MIDFKGRNHARTAVLLVSGALLGAALARAQPSAERGAAAVLDRAAEVQLSADRFTASFSIAATSQEGDLVTGVIVWYRAPGFERVDQFFDLPVKDRPPGYYDEIRMLDEQKKTETIILPNTKQAARLSAERLGGRHPKDWVFPVLGRSFGELSHDPRVHFAVPDTSSPEEPELSAVFDDMGRSFSWRLYLDPATHALVRAESPESGQTWALEYGTIGAGVVAAGVVREFRSGSGELIRRSELVLEEIRFEEPDPAVFQYLPRGGTLSDNRAGRAFFIHEDGTLDEIEHVVRPAPPRARVALLGLVAAGVVAVTFLRLHLQRR